MTREFCDHLHFKVNSNSLSLVKHDTCTYLLFCRPPVFTYQNTVGGRRWPVLLYFCTFNLKFWSHLSFPTLPKSYTFRINLTVELTHYRITQSIWGIFLHRLESFSRHGCRSANQLPVTYMSSVKFAQSRTDVSICNLFNILTIQSDIE